VLVFAHGIVGRADLPIPEAVFGAAAATVLVVSFAALAAAWSEPRLQRWPERRLFPIPVAVDVALGLFGRARRCCSATSGDCSAPGVRSGARAAGSRGAPAAAASCPRRWSIRGGSGAGPRRPA
jgi:hypothetical protein